MTRCQAPLPSPPLPFSFQDLRVGECLRWGLHGETTGTWNQSFAPSPNLPRFFCHYYSFARLRARPFHKRLCVLSGPPHTQIITRAVVYSAPENYRDSLAPPRPPPPLSPSSCVHGRGVSQESGAGVGIRWRTFCDLTHPPVDGARKGRRRRKKGGV